MTTPGDKILYALERADYLLDSGFPAAAKGWVESVNGLWGDAHGHWTSAQAAKAHQKLADVSAGIASFTQESAESARTCPNTGRIG